MDRIVAYPLPLPVSHRIKSHMEVDGISPLHRRLAHVEQLGTLNVVGLETFKALNVAAVVIVTE